VKIFNVPREVAVQKKARMKVNLIGARFCGRQVQKGRRPMARLNYRESNRKTTRKEEQEAL